MNTQPHVCAVMLTADRPDLTARAIRCFERQNYPSKSLLILDTGERPLGEPAVQFDCMYVERPSLGGSSIGALRNYANELASHASILIHWDSDDWSHPCRITDQVTSLEACGAEAVGYKTMLFWDRANAAAWIYSAICRRDLLGTSLCYWRDTWRKREFLDKNSGEDLMWLRQVKSEGSVSVPPAVDGKPLMIAELHGERSEAYPTGNASSKIVSEAHEWKRAEAWDERVRKILEAA